MQCNIIIVGTDIDTVGKGLKLLRLRGKILLVPFLCQLLGCGVNIFTQSSLVTSATEGLNAEWKIIFLVRLFDLLHFHSAEMLQI